MTLFFGPVTKSKIRDILITALFLAAGIAHGAAPSSAALDRTLDGLAADVDTASEGKSPLAVVEFLSFGDDAKGLGAYAAHRLAHRVKERVPAVSSIDRLESQGFPASDLMDDKEVAKLCKPDAARFALVGTVVDLSDNFLLTLRLVDETGNAVLAKREFVKKTGTLMAWGRASGPTLAVQNERVVTELTMDEAIRARIASAKSGAANARAVPAANSPTNIWRKLENEKSADDFAAFGGSGFHARKPPQRPNPRRRFSILEQLLLLRFGRQD